MMNYPPMWSPRFRVTEAFNLEYKPYPSYPEWLIAWDMLPLLTVIFDEFSHLNDMHAEQQDQIDDLLSQIDDLQNSVEQLQIDLDGTNSVANQALIDAATAYGLAETADIRAGDLEVRMNDVEARLDVLEA